MTCRYVALQTLGQKSHMSSLHCLSAVLDLVTLWEYNFVCWPLIGPKNSQHTCMLISMYIVCPGGKLRARRKRLVCGHLPSKISIAPRQTNPNESASSQIGVHQALREMLGHCHLDHLSLYNLGVQYACGAHKSSILFVVQTLASWLRS